MDEFMKRAIELAAENVRNGEEPFGAVLVKNGKLVSEGVNDTIRRYDVTAHAEIMAIRKAQKMMHTPVLDGYTMYASGEPCPMCLAAMYFVGIDQIYFASAVEDAAVIGLTRSAEIYEDLKKPHAERQVHIEQMPLEAGQLNPLTLWKENK